MSNVYVYICRRKDVKRWLRNQRTIITRLEAVNYNIFDFKATSVFIRNAFEDESKSSSMVTCMRWNFLIVIFNRYCTLNNPNCNMNARCKNVVTQFSHDCSISPDIQQPVTLCEFLITAGEVDVLLSIIRIQASVAIIKHLNTAIDCRHDTIIV